MCYEWEYGIVREALDEDGATSEREAEADEDRAERPAPTPADD